MKVPYKNETYDFPEGTTIEEMNDFLGASSPQSSMGESPEKGIAKQRIAEATGMNRTPVSTLQDILTGGLKGGQNIAATLGEAGNALASGLTRGYAPQVNIREEMGLGKDRPVDFQNLIGPKNPNPFIQGMAQYAPGVMAGGSSLPGQVASNALYSATQTQPNEQNAMGILPSGRVGGAIEGGVMGALPFAIPKVYGMAKNAIDKYLSPETTSNDFISQLGQGKTIPENIQELSNRIKYGQGTTREEALIPKHEIMSESGEKTLFPPSKTSTVEENLTGQKPVKGEYLNIKNPDEHYSDLIQEAHDSYVDNPTFRNSDKLRSRLFKRINELTKRQKAQTITDSQENELRSLTRNRNAIIKDQDQLISTFSPENQDKYGKFNKLWRENVRAYEEAGVTIKNMKNGFLNNVTPENITKAFSFPELKPQVQRILKDIGPSGVNNIIFNELGRAGNAEQVLKVLDKLERDKGFSPYITPDIKNVSQQIRSQLRNKRILKYGSAGTAGALGIGAVNEVGKNIYR